MLTVLESDETTMHGAYRRGFVLVLIACFTPFKSLAYLLPSLFVVGLLLTVPHAVSRNRMLGVCTIAAILPVFYAAIADEFLLANYAVALLTYSAFLPLLLLDSKQLASRELLRRLLMATAVMFLVQGCYGTLQAVYGALESGKFSGNNGDRVTGTIYPLFKSEHAFSNPMFAVGMSLMLIACLSLPEVFEGRRRVNLVIGSTSLVLAGVVHVLVFFMAAAVIAFVLTRGSSRPMQPHRRSRGLGVTLALVGVLAVAALGKDLQRITNVGEKAFDLEAVDVPRAILMARVLLELPESQPHQPFVGLGPGQFSSRASLIMSGLYLGGPNTPKTLPFLTPQATHLATDYCFLLLAAYNEIEEERIGSSQQPFFSFLSVYTEVGLVGLVLVLWAVGRVVLRVRRRVREDAHLRLQGLTFITGTLLLVFIGLQDNYWEAPQAILPGLLLLKVCYANIVHAPRITPARETSTQA